MVCHPHFGDQFSNSDLIVSKQIGVKAHNKNVILSMDLHEMVDQKFTAEDI